MPLTPQELALRLAKHLGVTSLDSDDPSNTSPSGRGLQPGDTAELAACINAALQEIWDIAPTALRFARFGVELKAPLSVTLDLENGSAAINSFTEYESWMEGCSIRIEGAEGGNELVDGGALLFPYTGPTGASVPATIYHDCVTPDGGVISMIDPVSIVGFGALRPAESRHEFEALWESGSWEQGVPRVYWVDRFSYPDPARFGLRLRLYPGPDCAMRLTYGARMSLALVTASDLEDGDPVPSFPIPGGWDESVLLPLAVQRLSLHPDFMAENLKTELPRQTAAAYRILRGASPRRSAGSLLAAFR